MSSHPIFNVLSSEPLPKKHFLLEASAGTGKTFAIENIFVRLIIEGNVIGSSIFYPSINQIAVLTFTRAAAAELKYRIRTKLTQTHDILLSGLVNEQIDKAAPDYIKVLLSKEPEEIFKSIQRIELAITHFNDHKITTIHGFCSQILQELSIQLNLSLSQNIQQSILPQPQLKKIILQSFHACLEESSILPEQLNHLLNSPSYKSNLTLLIDHFHKVLSRSAPIDLPGNAIVPATELHSFAKNWQKNYKSNNLNSYDLFGHLQGTTSRSGELKQPFAPLAKWLDSLNSQNADLVTLIQAAKNLPSAFYKTEIKKRSASSLNSEDLNNCNLILNELIPLLKKQFNRDYLFAKLAKQMQQKIQPILADKEAILFDTLVDIIHEHKSKPALFSYLRKELQACIIDEFQDTDSKQWEIFSSFCLKDNWQGKLILVGDPKQSIYRFRGADIYTYLNAQQSIGPNTTSSLTHNWRSHPKMVDALNLLFNEKITPNLFYLPSQNTTLNIPPLVAGNTSLDWPIKDYDQALHLMVPCKQFFSTSKSLYRGYTSHILPFVIQEIIKLYKNKAIPLHKIAILVKNRQQAKLVEQSLKQSSIPYSPLEAPPLFESNAYYLIKHTLKACASFAIRDIQQMLLNNIFNLSKQDLEQLELDISQQPKLWTHLSQQLKICKNALLEKGLGSMIETLMYHTSWLSQTPIGYSIRESQHAIEIEQILEALENNTQTTNPKEILSALETIKANMGSETTTAKAPQEHCVQIYTLHGSKGLEFDVVFALGVTERSPAKKADFILTSQNKTQKQIWVEENSQEYEINLQDLEAEKLRLFYVAMTRAKYLLYIPLFMLDDNHHKIKHGQASALELYIAQRSAHNSEANSPDYALINNNSILQFLKQLEKHKNEVCVHSIESSLCSSHKLQVNHIKPATLFTSPPTLNWDSYDTFSFSSMKNSQGTIKTNSTTNSSGPMIPKLPKGTFFGSFIHQILEHIPFKIIQDQKDTDLPSSGLIDYIRESLTYSPYTDLLEVILEQIYTALTYPLFNTLNSKLAICDLNERSFLREPHFLFQQSSKTHAFERIQGYIDAVVLIDDTLFILDWKTNDNGPYYYDYTQENLHNLMVQHNYSLQAKLYEKALKKRIQEKAFCNYRFGNTTYIFLRGLSISEQTGIYTIN